MNNSFDIVDGQLYMDKDLYNHAHSYDTHILALIGSQNEQLFKHSPVIRTGIESITIDYDTSDKVTIQGSPDKFVDDLKERYHNKLRGRITIANDKHIYKITVNNY